ncbi:uL15 family ribosomal protein [bacterium]|nr:uL15 family ribosomal protein [bacterium]
MDKYVIINVAALEQDAKIKTEVNKAVLKEAGYIKSISDLVKILGNGELKKSLNFTGIEKFTKSAVEKIEKAGGKIS